jgi:ABC-type glycerol-3-phosphate transport system permease component
VVRDWSSEQSAALVRLGAIIILSSFALLWSTPLWWMLVASLRDLGSGQLSDAALLPGSATTVHFRDAWQQGDFLTTSSAVKI